MHIYIYIPNKQIRVKSLWDHMRKKSDYFTIFWFLREVAWSLGETCIQSRRSDPTTAQMPCTTETRNRCFLMLVKSFVISMLDLSHHNNSYLAVAFAHYADYSDVQRIATLIHNDLRRMLVVTRLLRLKSLLHPLLSSHDCCFVHAADSHLLRFF